MTTSPLDPSTQAPASLPDQLRLVTAGSVDDGKSTLIGRLLFDSKAIFDDQWEQVREVSARRGDERVDLALVTDGLRAEREQGITIDVAYRYFSTSKRKFIIADAPGHVQYTRNMVTGASTADLAIVIIDARNGFVEQSKRHMFLASLLGVPHLVIAVNKMDLVGYSEAVFERIKLDVSSWSAKLEVRDLTFIPISAVVGDNVIERSANMPWYGGSNLLHHLETVHIASDHNLIDLRFPVQWVIRPQSDAYRDYRGYAGVVASGVMRPGDEVVILPRGTTTRITRVETFDGPLAEAFPPMAVTVHLKDAVDVSRGDMLCRPQNLPHIGMRLDAMVAWMSRNPLSIGKSYALKQGTRWTKATVSSIQYELNVNTLHRESAQTLALNGIGRVQLQATAPIPYDAYTRNRTTGSFILVDEASGETVGAGMLLQPHTEEVLALPASAETDRSAGDGRPGLFVTGTDTGVGKTVVSCALVTALRKQQVRAVGMKPIASGCEATPEGLRNDDARLLQAASGVNDYDLVNPIAFLPPIAPHIAAEQVGQSISLAAIEVAFQRLAEDAEFIVVEGAGGYRVPLATGGPTIAEIPKRLGLGVLLVVGIRVGCLSHAILTAEAIRADGLELVGWVANCPDSTVLEIDRQIATLAAHLAAPLLGVIPSLKLRDERDASVAHSYLHLQPLLSRLKAK